MKTQYAIDDYMVYDHMVEVEEYIVKAITDSGRLYIKALRTESTIILFEVEEVENWSEIAEGLLYSIINLTNLSGCFTSINSLKIAYSVGFRDQSLDGSLDAHIRKMKDTNMVNMTHIKITEDKE